MNNVSSLSGDPGVLEQYLYSRTYMPLLAEDGTLYAEALLLYFHTLRDTDQIDSRWLLHFLLQHTTAHAPYKTHETWIALAKSAPATEEDLTFREIDLRQTPQGQEFLMVNWLQAAVLVMSALRPEPFTVEQLVEQIFDGAFLHWSQRYDPDMLIPLLPLMMHVNETLEDMQQQKGHKAGLSYKRTPTRAKNSGRQRTPKRKEDEHDNTV
jgi:hypothetical protein